MPLKNIFYFDNTFAGGGPQRDVGPLHPGNVNTVYRAACRGELSLQSFTPGSPYITENDLLWGLQWVPHGSAPASVLTSPVDDHWFWRHALTLTNDVTRVWSPSSANGVVQGSDPLHEEYRGQYIKPVTDIDLFISIQASFGLLTGTFIMLGSVEFSWD